MNVDSFAARALAAFLTVSACAGAVAEPGPRTAWTRTRPLNSSAGRLLASAAQSSSIVAGLLDDLEQTDVVVYLSDAMPGVESGPASKLVFLAMAGTSRYLLVRVDR